MSSPIGVRRFRDSQNTSDPNGVLDLLGNNILSLSTYFLCPPKSHLLRGLVRVDLGHSAYRGLSTFNTQSLQRRSSLPLAISE